MCSVYLWPSVTAWPFLILFSQYLAFPQTAPLVATINTLWRFFSIWVAPSHYSSQHIYNQLLPLDLSTFTDVTNRSSAALTSTNCFLNSHVASCCYCGLFAPGSCALHSLQSLPFLILAPEVLLRDYLPNCIIFPKVFKNPTTGTVSTSTALQVTFTTFPSIIADSQVKEGPDAHPVQNLAHSWLFKLFLN